MKKVLFATTALVATAGVAAADVSLSGYAEAIFTNSGVTATDTTLVTAVELDVTFSGATDNGLAFGATMDLNGSGTSADPEMFISGAFGRINFGAIDDAGNAIGIADVGDSINVDNAIEALIDGAAADVSYVYSIDGLTLTLSTNVGSDSGNNAAGEGDFGMHVAYKMGTFTIEAGYNDENDTGDTSSGIELTYGMGDVTFGAAMISRDEAANSSDRDRSGFGASIAYKFDDALTVTGVYASVEDATAGVADQDDYGIGFTYDLGGGAKLVGGMGEVATLDRWDFGLQLSF
jgi:outer membrane protein OmpU